MSLHTLSPVARKFVLHWGEMGTRWGINRTVAQVHALLFLAENPLPAEEIAETLGIARSNASTSLRELRNRGIVKIVHLADDRRDHFESMHDVYAMFRVIAQERKKREIDPTIAVLRECIAESGKGKSSESYTHDRLADLLSFMELGAATFERLAGLPTAAILKLAKLGDKAFRRLGIRRD